MEKNPTQVFVVAAALVDENGQILVQKRPKGKAMPDLWEFPGGKVESNETPEGALVRELEEELGIVVIESDISPIAFASEALGDRHLILLLYICTKWTGQPQNLHASALRWLPVAELRNIPMPPADKPLVEQLSRMLS